MEKVTINGVEATEQYILERMFEYNLPAYMVDGMVKYLLYKIEPGSFMTAVMSNDLRECVACADETNSRLIKEWVMFLYNETPSDCWGSPEKVKNWLSKREIE